MFGLTCGQPIGPAAGVPRNQTPSPAYLITWVSERKMNCYTIVKVGDDYVVQVDRVGVLKFASRRKAARPVAEAADLLRDAGVDEQAGPSITS